MGVKDITIRLSGESAGLVSAFKTAESAAAGFKGKIEDFAKQYKSSMASAFDKSAAERLSKNIFGSLDSVRSRMLQQAKELKGIFTDTSFIKAQGQFSSMGAAESMIKRGTSQSFNLAAATGMDLDKASNMLAKSLAGNTRELQKIIPEVALLTKEELAAGAAIDLVANKYEGFGEAANVALRKAELSSKLKSIGESFKNIGESLSMYVTTPLVAGGGIAVKYASDTNESLNKVEVAFGKSANAVKSFSDISLNTFGIGKGAALDMSATFGDMATSMGLSTAQAAKLAISLTGLSGDLSSFKNIGIDIAQTALQSIFTGETESLKQLGIVMTETNLNAYALSKGIKTKVQAMGESEKVLLRYNYVLDKTKNSQGDFARTSAGAANQQRTLSEGAKQLSSSFGQVLIPIWERFLQLVNKAVSWLSELSTSTKTIIGVVAALAAAIGPLFIAIGFFTSTILPQLIAGGAALSAAWAPVTAVVLALAGAFAVFTLSTKAAQEQVQKMSGESLDVLNKKLNENINKINELKKNRAKQDYNQNAGTSTGLAQTIGAKAMGYVFGDKNAFSTSNYEIKKLEQENAKIKEAIALKEKQLKLEEDAKAKARELSDVLKAQLDANEVGEKLTGLIEKQEKKVKNLDDAIKKAKTVDEIKKIRDELIKAKKELDRLNELTLDKTKSSILNSKITSPFGTPAVVDATKDRYENGEWKKGAKGQWSGNAAGGIGKYMVNPDILQKTANQIKALKDMVDSFNQGVTTAITNTIEGIGTMFGQLAAGDGRGALKSFLSGFANMIGDFAIQMGKQLIAVGIGLEAFKASLKSMNGYAALAAGAALIIAGAAFKAFVGSSANAGESNRSTVISRQTPSGSAGSATTSTYNAIKGGSVKFVVKRGDLVGVLAYDEKIKGYV